jgi:hypothetical protein
MANPGLKRNPFQRLLWFLGLLALVMSVASVVLVHHYDETRPRGKNVALGRTHAVKIHGHMVYLTGPEISAAFFTHATAVLALGVFLGVLLKARSAKRFASHTAPSPGSTLRP